LFLRRTAPLTAFAAIIATGAMAGAQTSLVTETDGRSAPGGGSVISLRPGTRVAVISTRGASVLVNVEGWVDAARLAGRIDSFPASVDAKTPLRVHAAASVSAATVAELRPRAGVYTRGKSGGWMRIERKVWIPGNALRAASPPSPAPPSVAPRAAEPQPAAPRAPAEAPAAAAQASAGLLRVPKSAKLLAAPGGPAVGDVRPGTVVQSILRDRGFVKVRIEGWIPEREVEPADSTLGPQLTAADLRADPAAARGKLVRWDVVILALQNADPLRRELAPDEPYLLAKGPGTEDALLYLAVPPALLNAAKALPPLTRVLITATVRSGHSEPVGTPILDLKSISKR
jgi:hypothetical protein